MSHFKVGDTFILTDAEATGLSFEENGLLGIVTSLEYSDGYNDPGLHDRELCIYGAIDGMERCYFKVSCIRKLTPLEELL